MTSPLDASTTITVEPNAVKELIDKLEKKYESLRKAGKALGISHQNLSNWRDVSKSLKQREFLAALNKIFEDLDIPESKRGKFLK